MKKAESSREMAPDQAALGWPVSVGVLLLVSVALVALSVRAAPGGGPGGEDEAGRARPSPSGRLEDGFDSPEGLARAVLGALEASDREALEGMLVTREEHRRLLWDELPESSYLSFEYARDLNVRNTREGLSRALSRFGGRSLELVSLRFAGERESYPGFILHRGAELVARDGATGRQGELEVLDVVLEMDGHWKPMNYEE